MSDSNLPSDAESRNLATANRLHSAAIHLLRRLRRVDEATGLSAPKLSALSVLVFGGPVSLGGLAAAEQVRPPTITRLVRELEAAGLVTRRRDEDDKRVVRLTATEAGRRLLQRGRGRRVRLLAAWLESLCDSERVTIDRAVGALERLLENARSETGSDPGDGGE